METTILVQNLKCGGCANTISKKLQQLEGISNINITPEQNSVTFNYSTTEQLQAVKNMLVKLGYPPEGEANSISKKVKSYTSCMIGRLNS